MKVVIFTGDGVLSMFSTNLSSTFMNCQESDLTLIGNTKDYGMHSKRRIDHVRDNRDYPSCIMVAWNRGVSGDRIIDPRLTRYRHHHRFASYHRWKEAILDRTY
jgi:hypothetical protein